MSALLIRNGKLIDPAQGIEAERDLLFKDGRVLAIEPPGKLKTAAKNEGAEELDATGLVVAPG